MPSPIPVVCALIEHDGRVLIAQRPAHKHLPLKWEFPGGKVEPDEDPATAIVREIREELGCAVVITRPLPGFIHDYQTVVIEMLPYVCVLAVDSTAPHPHEHVALAWVKVDELDNYDLAAADLPIISLYRQLLGQVWGWPLRPCRSCVDNATPTEASVWKPTPTGGSKR